ncbi:hypothetical protein CCP3SC1_70055 [Gammaproteobacteria bacterium]
MARGGYRPGAGRKKGTKSVKTLERISVVVQAAEEGVTPLVVILEAMHAARKGKDLESAAKYAVMAAPYVHPRLAAVAVATDGGGLVNLSDREMDELGARQLALVEQSKQLGFFDDNSTRPAENFAHAFSERAERVS